MLTAALVSLGVVFLAELGDKSQLMTMTYALRHRWWVVLSGVAIASFLVHGLSVTIGHFVGLTLPGRPIAFAAAIAFLLFAAWTWRDGRGDGDEVASTPEPRYVIFAVISSFVLAELGDKTLLATVALAIAAGRLLHRRLPERFLHGIAAVLFLLFGLWMLFDNALGWPWVAVVSTAGVGCAVAITAAIRFARGRRSAPVVAPTPESSPEGAVQHPGYCRPTD
ncbi:MAG TPA: TMEM165/GDT1 family protein [Mycobacterium sp.]|nr:TMEM165/GDT1 family protein [Mycobacterium sp.]